jgi:hypothetical protein
MHTHATINFTRLPAGHVPYPEATPPAHVGAGESVVGFYLSNMPAEQERMMKLTNSRMGMAYLATTEAEARAYGSGTYYAGDPSEACLADGAEVQRQKGVSDDDPNWPTRESQQLTFQFDSPPTPESEPDVHAIHSERFVAGTEGHATLDVVDAWVDARTHGVRLLTRYSLPLMRVFTGPNDLEVFAARDGETTQVILHYATRASTRVLRDRLRSIVVTLPEQNMAVSDCGHVRFSLRAPAGNGQMGTFQSIAYLPARPEELAALDANVTGMQRERTELRMMRQRAYQLSISATSSSVDPHPIVSISLAWLGRERGADF